MLALRGYASRPVRGWADVLRRKLTQISPGESDDRLQPCAFIKANRLAASANSRNIVILAQVSL